MHHYKPPGYFRAFSSTLHLVVGLDHVHTLNKLLWSLLETGPSLQGLLVHTWVRSPCSHQHTKRGVRFKQSKHHRCENTCPATFTKPSRPTIPFFHDYKFAYSKLHRIEKNTFLRNQKKVFYVFICCGSSMTQQPWLHCFLLYVSLYIPKAFHVSQSPPPLLFSLQNYISLLR